MKISKRYNIVALLIITAFFVTSCTTMLPKPSPNMTDDERNAAKDQCIAMNTVGGAVLGGVVGGLLGGRDGAVKGAIAGGTTAFALAWGKCIAYYFNVANTQVADYKETAKSINYEPKKGTLVKLETLKASPSTLAPGKQITLIGKYYVLDPETTKDLSVTESFYIVYYDKEGNANKLNEPINQKRTIDPGTRKIEGPIDLPKELPEGRYKIIYEVSYKNQTDRREVEVSVKN
ncbi:MAG: hypothetical protein HQL06_00225 [Nitrospirae bacterium]|nr:hypothetical protein [Nitrospirota bacterium]